MISFGVQRLFDKNIRGGMIIAPLQTRVMANYLPVSVTGSVVQPHFPHKAPILTGLGSLTVRIGYLPVNRQFDKDTCGDIRLVGSLNVRVG